MANGKPWDRPVTDLVNHRLEVYSPNVDALVLEDYLLARPTGAAPADQLCPYLVELRGERAARGWETRG